MANGKFVSYVRVSTKKQERSGLGLEAQREAVRRFLNGGDWQLLGEFTEAESGDDNDRPELAKAMHLCKVTGATLLIAKLDRLSRNAAFLLALRDSRARFVAVDLPDANDLTIGVMAVVAQAEREAISQRTRAALAAAKARGVRLGCPNGAAHLKGVGNAAAVKALKAAAQERAEDVAVIIRHIQESGVTALRSIAEELNRRGILTARGGAWHAASVQRVLNRVTV